MLGQTNLGLGYKSHGESDDILLNSINSDLFLLILKIVGEKFGSSQISF